MRTMAEIIENKQIAENIYDMTVASSEIANEALPGQFAHIRVRDCIDPLLRRPISICEVNRVRGTVRFVYRSHGAGTRLLAAMEAGQSLDIIAPLGNGTFPVGGDFQDVYVIGGGIGVPPLLYAAKAWYGRGSTVHAVLGFAGKEQVILEQEFARYANVSIYTVDGSCGRKGLVTDYFTEEQLAQNVADKQPAKFLYFACGPKPMLKAIQQHSLIQQGTGYLSLEEHMACGIGACMGCVTKITDGVLGDWKYAKVCDCGPAFPAEKVVF